MRRIHRCIQSLLKAVPTGQVELFPVLASSFPPKRFELVFLQLYVSELLCICEYLPGAFTYHLLWYSLFCIHEFLDASLIVLR